MRMDPLAVPRYRSSLTHSKVGAESGVSCNRYRFPPLFESRMLLGHFVIWNAIKQRRHYLMTHLAKVVGPTLLGVGDWFCGNMDPRKGSGGWFQGDSGALHLLCALFLSITSRHNQNEIIIQLTVIQNHGEPWACFRAHVVTWAVGRGCKYKRSWLALCSLPAVQPVSNRPWLVPALC